MTKVNIVFDDDFEDADIIAIPNEIAAQIEALSQEFLNWVTNTTDSDYWTIIDGQKYVIAETDGFVKWLNSYYCLKTKKAYIVTQNINYCPQYKIVEF